MTCEKCGNPMKFKSGTKRETGKAWAGNFCENQNCKNVIWVDVVKEPVKFVGQDNRLKVDEKPNWDIITAEKEDSINWFNAKNNATLIISAMIKQGMPLDQAEQALKNWAKIIYLMVKPNGEKTL